MWPTAQAVGSKRVCVQAPAGATETARISKMKQARNRKKRIIPAFPTEAQEADWWYKNRKTLDGDFEKAARNGELKVLDRKALLRRVERSKTSKVISIRLAESDLELARLQADPKGLPYQTYIKSLLHQALESRAKAR